MLDLQLLKTFLTVLETGNYSNAALQLDYVQSTVTKHMQLLEGAYQGTKLLQRQGNRMVPTEQGLVLQRYAVRMLQLYEDSRSELILSQRRTIRIGTIHALSETYLPVVIRQIKAAYPQLNIHLTNGSPPFLHAQLRSGQLDAIFLVDTRRRYDGFTVREIRQEPLVVVTPRKHPLAGRESVSFEDIRDQQFILTQNGCSFRKFLLREFSGRGQTPRIVMELDSMQAIRQAVAQRYGVGFMPALLAAEDDDLCSIPFAGGHAPIRSMMIYAQNDLLTPPFMDRLADAITAVFPPQG
ncbi:MAG: LysR family transcriptional regulator [Oscillibacter sp.]|nr:LysR family transcriptional regulator [Oscillibacter sp.]